MATPTQIRRRGRWSLILGTIFAFAAFAAVAYADNISNESAPPADTDDAGAHNDQTPAARRHERPSYPVVVATASQRR